MLSHALALKLFEGFSIERWNDLVRPFALVEMDKAAEKMVIAYMIAQFEQAAGRKIEWQWMMYACLFDLLKKIALCDIKSPVQRMIKKRYPEEYAKLNAWVIEQYEGLLGDDLLEEFSLFVQDKSPAAPAESLTWRVLRAAHKYATMRELQMVSMVNEPVRILPVEHGLNADIQEFLDLRGLQLLITRQNPYEFLMIIEQLRFQTRWNQTPRVPRTSVLGHSLYVAILTLFLSRELKPCPKREYNNFFSALFHDLPEAVTRDIISPVKRATSSLPSIVKTIEDEFVDAELRPLMDECYADELLYFTQHEFENRVRERGTHELCCVSFEQLQTEYNTDEADPVDGALVRAADHIAAFIEAESSIKHGITSAHLREGRANIIKLYPEGSMINGFDAASFFRSL